MHARHGTRFLNALLPIAALALTLLTTAGALAAPPDDRVLPVDQYTSPKARTLGARYAAALHDLNAAIYHCLPWLDVPKESIGFFRPKHLPQPRDDRYLALRIYITQDASPQFAALTPEERASAMFSRYVGAMLRRMAGSLQTIQDPRQRLDMAFALMEQQSQERLPAVEKFPVHFYEDGITSLENALRLRQMVAFEHWQGNTACTLGEVIQKVSAGL